MGYGAEKSMGPIERAGLFGATTARPEVARDTVPGSVTAAMGALSESIDTLERATSIMGQKLTEGGVLEFPGPQPSGGQAVATPSPGHCDLAVRIYDRSRAVLALAEVVGEMANRVRL